MLVQITRMATGRSKVKALVWQTPRRQFSLLVDVLDPQGHEKKLLQLLAIFLD